MRNDRATEPLVEDGLLPTQPALTSSLPSTAPSLELAALPLRPSTSLPYLWPCKLPECWYWSCHLTTMNFTTACLLAAIALTATDSYSYGYWIWLLRLLRLLPSLLLTTASYSYCLIQPLLTIVDSWTVRQQTELTEATDWTDYHRRATDSYWKLQLGQLTHTAGTTESYSYSYGNWLNLLGADWFWLKGLRLTATEGTDWDWLKGLRLIEFCILYFYLFFCILYICLLYFVYFLFYWKGLICFYFNILSFLL